ncbi:hypothetical protein LTR56_001146 [Elasticomyces elasticus]|nr:hypothetical protein LTR56_001146 [Elasticomyces elasticus]KAK3663546.1 hypothetical protein LTR22_005718 [Elasticomyces elasticus]KAK4927067.1 hypothetical protein LTR49_005982 [Elasticomyces elasticus]KAK5769067.1 hypothetical protein LTS12_000781 [Elasticomyces elasticus]
MARSLRQPSVPGLNKCFPWPSKKELTGTGVNDQIEAEALGNSECQQDTATATVTQDKANVAPREVHLTPSNSTHDLAVFLRTTGPRGRESHRAPMPTRRRSKSLPRRLLGQLREYWKPTHDLIPTSASYKYDERLQAWVRGSPLDTTQPSDAIVERTTSKGHKYFELKGPPTPRTNGVFSRGDDSHGEPPVAELDRLVLRDLTSDELMDGWLADLGEKVDSCSDSAHQSLPPSRTASVVGAHLLPSTQADESVVAARTPAPTRASSTTAGGLSIWAPAVLTRESTSTVIRHTRAPRESRRGDEDERLLAEDRRASLWELEDTGLQNVDHSLTTPRVANDNHEVGGVPNTWHTPPRSPKSMSPVRLDKGAMSVVSQTLTNRTFYTSASDDSDLDASTDIRARERRGTEPSSGRAVVPRGSYRSNSFDEVAHRSSTSVTHVHGYQPSNQVLVGQRRPKGSVPSLCSNEANLEHSSSTMRYIAPKYSPEARDFFMQEIDDAARLSHATRCALLYAKDSECVFCAASPMPYTYRPTGPFSSEIDLTQTREAQEPSKLPRHVQSEELLGKPNAWNQTKPLPKAPGGASTKMPHISTLSRSASSLHSDKTGHPKYAQAPTPPPEKSLPALPFGAEHPGLRAERARVGLPPHPGAREPVQIKRKPLVSDLPTTPKLRKVHPYRGTDLRSLGAQQVVRPNGGSARRLADMEMLEGQLCEIQSKVIQLSAMVVEVLTKQY